MKDATLNDAKLIARLHNLESGTVWKVIRGVRYSDPTELAHLVLDALSKSNVSQGRAAKNVTIRP